MKVIKIYLFVFFGFIHDEHFYSLLFMMITFKNKQFEIKLTVNHKKLVVNQFIY